jgi:hypothetical protein
MKDEIVQVIEKRIKLYEKQVKQGRAMLKSEHSSGMAMIINNKVQRLRELKSILKLKI